MFSLTPDSRLLALEPTTDFVYFFFLSLKQVELSRDGTESTGMAEPPEHCAPGTRKLPRAVPGFSPPHAGQVVPRAEADRTAGG